MEIKVTFRHKEPDEKLKEYAEREVEKVSRLLYRPIEAQVIFSREKSRVIAEMNILADHSQFFARSQGEDFYLTFDQVVNKVETQVKKYHDRRKRSKGRRPVEEAVGEGSELGIPEIVRSSEFFISKPITVEEAVEVLENGASGFIAFRNAENEKICVVYRRQDGNYGLIEPE